MENEMNGVKKRFIEYEPPNNTPWKSFTVQRKEAYGSSVKGYHRHTYYEMNLILSGSVHLLTAEGSKDVGRGTLILSPPYAPHYVKCDNTALYKRVYLMFTEDYVSGLHEWSALALIFGDRCATLTLSEEEISWYLDVIDRIEKEKDPLPAKMLIYYLLSVLVSRPSETNRQKSKRLPEYLLGAMTFIEEHLDEHITAEDLARLFHVGRTTLMTGFKKHAGLTVGEYIDIRRLERAAVLLRNGETVEFASARCGFSDSGGLIRLFKRYYGVSPMKFIKK
jgi:AraC-like DNA-binding protein